MVIKASSSKEVDALVADLSSTSPVKRDSAAARLTVIGARSLDRLIALALNLRAPATARVAAFRALDAIGDPRAMQPAMACFNDPESSVASAALAVARGFVDGSRGVEALDRVIAIALDRRRMVGVRIAAIHALADLPEATVKPVMAQLKEDPDPEIANVLQPARHRSPVNTVQRLESAASGTLPGEPSVLKSAVSRSANDVPLDILHQVVERIRIHEGTESAERRAEWMAVRAAAHAAIAERGSRLALYDLRETIESARGRLPVEFFAAVTAIGDATCLESIAHAYARAKDDWSRRQLTGAFRTIVQREKITRRHIIAKRIIRRSPGLWDMLLAAPS